MDIRHLDGTKVKAGIGYKHLKLLEPRRSGKEERTSSHGFSRGFPCIILL